MRFWQVSALKRVKKANCSTLHFLIKVMSSLFLCKILILCYEVKPLCCVTVAFIWVLLLHSGVFIRETRAKLPVKDCFETILQSPYFDNYPFRQSGYRSDERGPDLVWNQRWRTTGVQGCQLWWCFKKVPLLLLQLKCGHRQPFDKIG